MASVLLASGLAGCGKKGPPLPPLQPRMPRLADVQILQRGPDLVLHWSAGLEDGPGPPTTIRGFRIYRGEATGELDADAVEPSLLRRRLTLHAEPFAEEARRGERFSWTDAGAADTGGAGWVYTVSVTIREKGREVAGPVFRIRPGQVPPTPAGLTAEAVPGGARLSWEPAAEEATTVRLYRSPDEEPRPLDPTRVVEEESSLRDEGLREGTTYRWWAARARTVGAGEALQKLGTPPERKQRAPWEGMELVVESPLAGPVSSTVVDLYPPPVPGNLRAFAEDRDVVLLWNPVEAADLAGYHVYRSREGEEPRRLTSDPLTDTVYRDMSVQTGRRYVYRVTAVDRREPPNESDFSEPDGAETTRAAPEAGGRP